jgi:hypothetical protein
MKRRILAAVAGGVILAAVGVSAAGNFVSSASSDFFTSGKHEFYVWCAGSADSTAVSDGVDAESAQMTLYRRLKAAGRSACWPVWQGRLGG